jgi:hypothetical protein
VRFVDWNVAGANAHDVSVPMGDVNCLVICADDPVVSHSYSPKERNTYESLPERFRKTIEVLESCQALQESAISRLRGYFSRKSWPSCLSANLRIPTAGRNKNGQPASNLGRPPVGDPRAVDPPAAASIRFGRVEVGSQLSVGVYSMSAWQHKSAPRKAAIEASPAVNWSASPTVSTLD